MTFLETEQLLDLSHTIAGEYLRSFKYPWQALTGLKNFILTYGATLSPDEYDCPSPGVWIAKSATVAPTAFIGAPTIICAGAEIRHGAFIRGSAIVGENATVGNSSELKNAILFDRAQAPHFNYIGDSILGYRAHTGAGAITSNLKSIRSEIFVRYPGGEIGTGLEKFGAVLGDNVEVGCNSVLNPGTVIGRGSVVYPLSPVRGYVPEGCIYKAGNNIVEKN
jgi:NDP-sugar pyrophosphorylase family protein